MTTYKELVEGGMSPEEARKFLLSQRVEVIAKPTLPTPIPVSYRVVPPLEKYAPLPREAVGRETISPRISAPDLAKVLGRLDGVDTIVELEFEFDGKRGRVTRGIRNSKHGYLIKFESPPPKVLFELKGARDVWELKSMHEGLRDSHPQLDIPYPRWVRDRWVFEGRLKVPGDIWRWDAHLAARELLAMKPTKLEVVTSRTRIYPRPEMRVSELPLKFRLTRPPEYYAPHE